jgi:hypothetical protein
LKENRTNQKNVNVSSAASHIVEELCRKNQWPKGSEAQLPECVQASLTNWDQFRSIVKDLERSQQKDRNRRLRFELFRNAILSPGFVTDWWQAVYRQIADWDDWSGNLAPFTFSVFHKRFDAVGFEVCQKLGLSETYWSDFIKQVRKRVSQ